jgi:hypothetical protein
VSFSRDTEGGEEELSKVRGGRQSGEATLSSLAITAKGAQPTWPKRV